MSSWQVMTQLGWSLKSLRTRLHFNRIYRCHHGYLKVQNDSLQLLKHKRREATISLDECWSVNWSEITRIIAFKRDLYAVDLICLALVLRSDTFVEADEEMEGWQDLLDELGDRFAIPYDSWFQRVAVPAFSPNRTVLWPPQSESRVENERQTT